MKRVAKELECFETDPPPGISLWCDDTDLSELHAVISGPEGTAYENGQFSISLHIPPKCDKSFTVQIAHHLRVSDIKK